MSRIKVQLRFALNSVKHNSSNSQKIVSLLEIYLLFYVYICLLLRIVSSIFLFDDFKKKT